MAKKKIGYTFPGIDQLLKELVTLKSTIETNEAKKKVVERQLIERAGWRYWVQTAGSLFEKTISFLNGTRRAAITFPDKFGTVATDQEDTLRTAFADKFDQLFEAVSTFKLKKGLSLGTVKELVGAEIFDKLFDTSTVIAAKAGMDQAQLDLTEEQRDTLETIGMVQSNCTVKLYDLKAGELDKYNVTELEKPAAG